MDFDMKTPEFKKALRVLGWKGKLGRLSRAIENEGRTLFVLINPAIRPELDCITIYMNEAIWEKEFHDLASEIGELKQTMLLKTMNARTRPQFDTVDETTVQACDKMIMDWAKNLSYRQMLCDHADRDPEQNAKISCSYQLAAMVLLDRRDELECLKSGVISGRYTAHELQSIERAINQIGTVSTL